MKIRMTKESMKKTKGARLQLYRRRFARLTISRMDAWPENKGTTAKPGVYSYAGKTVTMP